MLSSEDVISILTMLSYANVVRLNKISGDWYSIYCPFHSGGQERRPSSGILINTQTRNGKTTYPGFFHCFTCGKSVDISQFFRDLQDAYEIPSDTVSSVQEILNKASLSYTSESLIPDDMMKVFNSNQAVNYIQTCTHISTQYVSEGELANYRYTVPYMYQRGLTDDIIDKYDIGVDMNFIPPGRKRKVPCITFPVKDEYGNCLFVARRSIENKNFFLPTNIEKPVYGLYELPNDTRSIVITESCFNALTCVKYGKPAVALFGTGTPYQVNQIRRLGAREIILGFDPDEAGYKAAKRWKKYLKDVAIVWSFEGIPEGQDINDLTYSDFCRLSLI